MLLGAFIGALLLLRVEVVAPLILCEAILAAVCIAAHLESRRRQTPERA